MSGLDFFALGRAVRAAAADAHDGDVPDVSVAWSFVLDNPECFVERGPSMGAPELERECEWPAEMPAWPPTAFYNGYHHAGRTLRLDFQCSLEQMDSLVELLEDAARDQSGDDAVLLLKLRAACRAAVVRAEA